MPVTLNDIVRVVPRMSIGAQDNVNTFHFKVTLAGHVSEADFMARVATLLDTLYTLQNSQVGTALTYDNIEGQNITKNELLPTVLWPVLVTGLNTADLVPRQAAVNVFFRTLRPKTRSTKQLGAWTESVNDASAQINSTGQAAAQAYGDSLVATLSDAVITLQYGAYNRPLNRFTPVNAAIVNVNWGTRKSRVAGVGS